MKLIPFNYALIDLKTAKEGGKKILVLKDIQVLVVKAAIMSKRTAKTIGLR